MAKSKKVVKKSDSSNASDASASNAKAKVGTANLNKVMAVIHSAISHKPKHYTKTRLRKKFADKFKPADVRAALKKLRSKKVVVKVGNVFAAKKAA